MEPEADRAQLAAAFPGWRVWRNGSLVYAWLVSSKPPMRFYAATVGELRERMEKYEAEHGG